MNNKKEMEELTFCIPIRIDSEYRMRNLLAVLNFFSKHINVNYIILEADCEQRVKNLPDIAGIRYEFVYDENPVFHRTHYINRMLSTVSTVAAAIWDADAIVPISQLWQAYINIICEKVVFVYPYDGRFWHINDYFSSIFCDNLKISLFTDFQMPRTLMCGYYSVGGAFLVNVELYKLYGWENEYFVGWGPEDSERYRRMQILGQSPIRISGSLYHLYHSRGLNSIDYDEEVVYKTKKEYSNVCGMSPEGLKKYIETWNWIK